MSSKPFKSIILYIDSKIDSLHLIVAKVVGKISILCVILLLCIVSSCGKKEKKSASDSSNDIQTGNAQQVIDVSPIAITTKDVGKFPFLAPPTGYVYSELAKNMNFAEVYHFYNDSSIVTIGGKYYKTAILKSGNNKEKFSDSLVIKKYEEEITRLGGVEIYSGDKPLKIIDMLDEDEHRPSGANYRQFIIRTPQGNIWFEFCSGYQLEQVMYSVIYEGETREPVWFMKAERMKEAIDRNGKVVLYINFDKNQATLKPDGVWVVNEIAKLMDMDRGLRLSVEGHTDNLGTPEYNKRLSLDRARTVVTKLGTLKVPAYRFKIAGFGAEHLLVTSNVDENRSLNRRVELIRTNVMASGLKEDIDKDGKAILHIAFDPGKATLKPQEMEIVEEIAKLMEQDKTLKLSVEGHTDNTGLPELNENLSWERARTIVKSLEDMKISRGRLKAAGYGSNRPLVANNSDANKAKNRRVEIVKIK